MGCLQLTAAGAVENGIAGAVAEAVEARLGWTVRRDACGIDPAPAFDAKRRQHSSSEILRRVAESRLADAAKVLALTEADLFIPMLSFIYGQAQLGGAAAVVSLARLRQEFYGEAADADLLRERAVKEALHELGHTCGLVHCADARCVMSLSTNIRQVDVKRSEYCAGCRRMLAEGGAAEER